MPLKLVLGPANSAKAGEVLSAFSAVAPRGAVLVVPTASDALHYRHELAGQGTVLGAVMTFSGLASEIARRAQYSARRLSPRQRDELLRAALAATPLQALAQSARAPGFRRAAAELIAELERELITPQRWQAALRSWAAEDPRRALYAEEVGRIYRAYARECERRGWVDSELFAWRALDALRARPDRWGRDAVFFYGFDDLTKLERDAVETLARIVGAEVTVSLTFEPGRAALQARAEVAAELAPLADEVAELPARDEHYVPAARTALHHLERQLFAPDPEAIDPGDAVILLEAGGERAEAELVAGEILRLLRAGMPAEEIAVVYRAVGPVAGLIARVFSQYGIPVAAEYEIPFAHTPLGRGLCGAARCAFSSAATAADLLAYLRVTGMLERPETADALDAELRRAGASSAAAARRRLGWNLGEIDALGAATDPGAELCRLARWLFALPHRRTAPILAAEAALDARALAALEHDVGELVQLGRHPGATELLELLAELMVPAVAAESGGDRSGGEVRLAEPLQIRARRYRAVFICGLQEGEFPRPAHPEPFLSDERRHELAVCSGLRLRRHEDVLDRERYLFYATVSRATERVTLSYRSSDEEGNLALASPFVADVVEILDPGWAGRRRRRLLGDVVWPAADAPTARERARARAALSAPADGDEPEPDRRLGTVARGRLRHTEILSAGALETYADCPVKWLIERELRPGALEPEPEPIVRGNLMHAVLERLLAELHGPLTAASLSRAEEILGGLLQELASGPGSALGAGQPEVVRTGALRAIEADLRRYLRHDAGHGGEWQPFGLELRFGFGEAEDGSPSLPALALGDGSERVLVRGMIDRVDADAAGRAVVRDYKSGAGRANWPAARWSSDRRLQVALYLVVVSELTELEPVGGFYQPLRGEDLRGRGMFVTGTGAGTGAVERDGRSPEEFAAALDDAVERAIAVAAELRSGRLAPCPQTCSRDGCAYPGICRSQ
jgi:ATP-dependent helicase/DNAse subunit B